MRKTCYIIIESCVKVNRYTSIYFNFSRGIRQGCLISTLLYIIVAETLAEAVLEESEIKGIQSLDGLGTLTTETRLYQTLINLGKLFTFLKSYKHSSRAKVNLQKTQDVLTGTHRYEKDTSLNIRLTNDKK